MYILNRRNRSIRESAILDEYSAGGVSKEEDVSREEMTMADVTFFVKQHKEMLEAVLGFETCNRYSITTSGGSPMAQVAESSGWFLRHFLRGRRPFEMNVTGPDRAPLLKLTKAFAFLLHRLEVFDADGTYLGAVQREFSLLNRTYIIEDAAHRPQFQIFGPMWWPWTFTIRKDGTDVGMIKKKWSGFLKEALTDADNFSVTCPADWDGPVKSLLLGAVLLIDFIHFEN